MLLEKLSVAVRPRNNWEAMDLGFLMARRWWWPLTAVGLILSLPIFLFAQWIDSENPYLFALILWWFKPLWEKAQLHILSHALFGEVPSLKQTLKAMPSLLKQDGLAWLTYRRFSMSRSMNMPISQLENLRGTERSKRIRVLHGVAGTGSRWLTIVGIHLEMLFSYAAFILVMFLIPEQMSLDWEFMIDLFYGESAWLGNLSWYLAIILVAPFYVAAGFSLYLNRRTWLEGWDIELVFRRLNKRLKHPQALGALLLCSLLLSVFPTQEGWASTSDDPKTVQQQIDEVMAREEFHQKEKKWVIEGWEDWFQSKQEKKETSDAPWLQSFVDFINESAIYLRALFWIVVIGIILFFLFKYRYWLRQVWQDQQAPSYTLPPSQLFGLDIDKNSLPTDVIAAAQDLWQQQKFRDAVALLYRASLHHLIHQAGLRFSDSDTEERCLQQVREHLPADSSRFFQLLTHYWVKQAYGHQAPEDAVFQLLCRQWPQHFGAPQRG